MGLIEHLERALHFAALGQRVSMREAMLDAWREHPSPDLRHIIVAEPLSADFLELAEEVSRQRSVVGLSPLFTVLRRHLNDPRLTPMLLELTRLPLDDSPLTRRELVDLWHKNRDSHGADVMEPLGGHTFAAEPLPMQARALVDRLARPVPLYGELQAVYADPASDAARAVFADFLLERGDEWGALIALQYGAPSGAEETRLRSTLDARLGELLGPDVTVLELERGFPVSVRAESALTLRATPAWRLVQELRLRGGAPHPTFLKARELERLGTIWDLRASLSDLEPGRCHIHTFGFTSEPVPPELGALVGRLPSAKQIIINGASFATVLQVCIDRELERLELSLKGQGWKLRWAGQHVSLECGPRLAGEWYDVFRAARERTAGCHLHVKSRGDKGSIEALGRMFKSMTLER
ncbi:MAG: TIGR02996 domain-containing protein [Myxococcaceae bacterium]|nr:TIGR02996 domain-containing protein [Myxococcaceae bacterium]